MDGRVAALDVGMARGLVAFRWFALAWACVGLAAERHLAERFWLGVLALGVAGAVTVAATLTANPSLTRSVRSSLAVVEVVVAAGLLLGEDLVYEAGRQQSLAWAWPAAGVIAVAVALGTAWSVGSAVTLAVCSFIGESLLRGENDWSVSAASKAALLVLAALSASAVVRVLRRAEVEISTARAREEMGRVLHDGVLQTLAVIQRRSTDDDLRGLARDQERDLRAFIADGPTTVTTNLSAALRSTVDTVSRRHGIDVSVAIADDLPDRPSEVVEAIIGAIGEALTNAAKHSGADRISVFAEPEDDKVYFSVSDNGCGFDPALASKAGRGVASSIVQRVEGAGGRVSMISSPGSGSEVELWIP
ncbi:MAG: hypothetical protein GY925_14135 [Actinomycetia bacterium]|nr:hypothetical protein [Actinomycetes bacterium]